MKRVAAGILGAWAAVACLNGADAQNADSAAYLNTGLSFEERASDLVHRMTLPEKASQLVNQARAIQRLGVPAYDWWSEALHGVARDGTTEFPEPVGLAATFDSAAIHEMAGVIGIEGRIKHAKAEAEGCRSRGTCLSRRRDWRAICGGYTSKKDSPCRLNWSTEDQPLNNNRRSNSSGLWP
ncbi:MAG TPA: hypothetical protein VNO35_27555 [Steroidobacteraceae bacterium]|nr:hypothetical protein [Steroidobacteraceae bacterium]